MNIIGRRRFIEVVREEVKLVGVGEEDAEDKRVRWRDVIGCAPPHTTWNSRSARHTELLSTRIVESSSTGLQSK